MVGNPNIKWIFGSPSDPITIGILAHEPNKPETPWFCCEAWLSPLTQLLQSLRCGVGNLSHSVRWNETKKTAGGEVQQNWNVLEIVTYDIY